ncbi:MULTISPECIES: recombinase family protein [Actinomycetes]|uniref:recombinase family protein n=1 Tax=Actinomycetes TaxID=1760 RepID=UPI0001B5502D|nr:MULTISPECIES: recombinase family protein [Actinomycetes]
MTPYIALYLRISISSPDSIEDQDMQGREYCARVWPGVPIVVFAEDGFSGEKEDVIRPEYDRLRAAVGRREVAQIWCAEQGRLERNPVRWFQLAQELVSGGITELHTRREGIVHVDSEVADIRAVFNAREVRKLRQRVNDKLATNAARGNAPAALPFGYRREGKTFEIVPEQAAEIRQAAERVLAGWSMKSIALDMRTRNVGSARGGTITGATVKAFLTTPAIAGLRVYRGEVVGQGNWKEILDVPTWRTVCAKLSRPRRVAGARGPYEVSEACLTGSTGRKYLLTGGLIVCGVCNAPLIGSMKTVKPVPGKPPREPKPYFFCHNVKGGRGCVAAVMAGVDEYVLDQLWEKLDSTDFLRNLGGDDHAEQRDQLTRALSDLDSARLELAAEWATPGALTMSEWREARTALDAQKRNLMSDLAALPAPRAALPNIALTREAWPKMTLDERRGFVRMFVERVVLYRAILRGSKVFDDRRVDIEWRRR